MSELPWRQAGLPVPRQHVFTAAGTRYRNEVAAKGLHRKHGQILPGRGISHVRSEASGNPYSPGGAHGGRVHCLRPVPTRGIAGHHVRVPLRFVRCIQTRCSGLITVSQRRATFLAVARCGSPTRAVADRRPSPTRSHLNVKMLLSGDRGAGSRNLAEIKQRGPLHSRECRMLMVPARAGTCRRDRVGVAPRS